MLFPMPLPFALVVAQKLPRGQPPIPNTPQGVLTSERRRRMYDAILAEPGMNNAALAHSLGMGPAVFFNHLKRLEAAGLVERVPDGHLMRIYPAHEITPPLPDPLSTSESVATAKVVVARALASTADVAEDLGITQREARRRVKTLLEAGLLRIERDGRAIRYAPTLRLRAIVERAP